MRWVLLLSFSASMVYLANHNQSTALQLTPGLIIPPMKLSEEWKGIFACLLAPYMSLHVLTLSVCMQVRNARLAMLAQLGEFPFPSPDCQSCCVCQNDSCMST